MLKSMTGFARADSDTAMGLVTLELRAVNHRYLDVQFRLPEELRGKEQPFRNQIAGVCKRGKVECSIHVKRRNTSDAAIVLNEHLAKQIGRAAETLAELLPDTRRIDPVDVLRWPGVVEEPEIDTEPFYEASRGLLEETLVGLDEMRQNEGARIADMLESRCADILAIAADVRSRLPEVLDAVRNRQRERIDKLDVAADPARLETELALIAQKLDVDEELDRLESHVSEIRAVLGNPDAVGRRLDFLMQELNREANTLGSKSADTQTTRSAVELKVLIEQMREQIQNVE